MLAPALIAAYALAFVSALGNFGIPALLGIPARYTTLPVLIWQRLASFGPSVLTDMAVIAAMVAVLAVVAVLLQMWLASRRRRNALIGPPQPPLDIHLGRSRPCGRGRAGTGHSGHADPAGDRAVHHGACAHLWGAS